MNKKSRAQESKKYPFESLKAVKPIALVVSIRNRHNSTRTHTHHHPHKRKRRREKKYTKARSSDAAAARIVLSLTRIVDAARSLKETPPRFLKRNQKTGASEYSRNKTRTA
jgi:hypothetical protein